MTPFAPLTYPDGYLPTEDYGLIGDLSTAALVGRDGSIPWLCLPHFDSPPVFCGILDKDKGGAFTVAPVGLQVSRQYYLEDSGVLITEMRDAAFSVYALRQVGIDHEAQEFLGWVLDALERHNGPKILYSIHGDLPPAETEDGELSGYRNSAPVRWSNGAAEQAQHDGYGEIVDCAYLWARGGGTIDAPLWEKLCVLIERAREVWREPDQGIWEVRCSGRPFTYSVAMCHVALERGARLAERYGLPSDAEGWRKEAELIRETILENAWDDELGSFTEHIGPDGGLDASLLALPLRRVIDANHPKMKATTEAVVKHLSAKGAESDGLLYRYLPEWSPDGLGSDEGAFVLPSFWLVDILADQGRVGEAEALFHSLCNRVNHLGLFAEEIDPDSGGFLGNFPQAFSHIGVITSATNLVKRKEEQDA